MSKGFQFHRGQFISAEVVENIDEHSLIVNLRGRLLQIKNKTNVLFSIGDKVQLVVSTVDPLSFSLALNKESRSDKINIQV